MATFIDQTQTSVNWAAYRKLLKQPPEQRVPMHRLCIARVGSLHPKHDCPTYFGCRYTRRTAKMLTVLRNPVEIRQSALYRYVNEYFAYRIWTDSQSGLRAYIESLIMCGLNSEELNEIYPCSAGSNVYDIYKTIYFNIDSYKLNQQLLNKHIIIPAYERHTADDNDWDLILRQVALLGDLELVKGFKRLYTRKAEKAEGRIKLLLKEMHEENLMAIASIAELAPNLADNSLNLRTLQFTKDIMIAVDDVRINDEREAFHRRVGEIIVRCEREALYIEELEHGGIPEISEDDAFDIEAKQRYQEEETIMEEV